MLRLLAVPAILLMLGLAGCSEDLASAAPPVTVLALTCPGLEVANACDSLLPGTDVNEFSIAANPLDPTNAIVTANDYGAGDEAALLGIGPSPHGLWGSWWWTKDAGATWERNVLPGRFPDHGSSLFGYEFVGDLVVEFDAKGTAYISGIGYSSTGSHNALFLTTSMDGGETFAEPTLVDSAPTELVFHDKPALLIAADGSVVVVWNFEDNAAGTRGVQEGGNTGDMRVAVSKDGGATWTAGPFSTGDNGISASLAQTPDGVIHCAWRAYEPNGILYANSVDGGTTWSAPDAILEFDATSITTPNAPYRTFVLPALTATPDGVLHAVAAPKDDDDASRVVLLQSTDGGATWTNEPFGGTPEGSDAFLPALTSAPDGRLAALWLDRRLDDKNADYQAWMAFSANGTVWADLQVSSGESSAEGATTFIGDYLDVAISGDLVYAAWPDLRDDGSSHLRVAVLEFRETARTPSPP